MLNKEYIEKNTDVFLDYREEIPSTNDLAKEIISSKKDTLCHFTKSPFPIYAIFAENQTKGRGTNGRVWKATKEQNILLSLLFYPNRKVTSLAGITYKIAEMIKEAIKDLYGIDLEIKLPNDLLLNGKKICGILTEASVLNGTITDLIIGIGFNVNQEEFESDLKEIATSLKKEYPDGTFKREEIVVKIINNIKSLGV